MPSRREDKIYHKVVKTREMLKKEKQRNHDKLNREGKTVFF